jgi:branched-chain amino acid transport system permease protein
VGFETFAQTCFSGLANGALYGFIALGFSLINRSTGIINFAQGDVTMLGGMLAAILTEAGLPLPLAVPLAALVCAAVWGLFYLLAIRPARSASMSQLTIMTIGLSILIRGAVVSLWGSDPRAEPSFSGDMPLNVAGLTILPQELWLIGALVVAGVATAWFFKRTMLGLALRASAANPVGAAFMGIAPQRLGFAAFVMAGLLGGLGGAIWTPIYFAQVDVGVGLGLKGFAAAVIGGIGSAYGPLAGGLLLAIVEGFAGSYVSSAWQDAILYGLMLLILLVRPQGLLGKRYSATEDEKPIPAITGVRSTALSGRLVAMAMAASVAMMVVPAVVQGAALTSIIFGADLAIVVLGLVLVTGYGGQLALGQGAFMMIGAYASGYLTTAWNWPPLAALLFGMLCAAGLAIVLGRIIFRLRGYYLSMASLAVLMIALTVAREWSSVTGGSNGLPGIPPFSVLGFAFVSDAAYARLFIAVATLVGLLALSITRSQAGRALLAIRSSETAARACGVSVVGLRTQVFAFSAAAASLAGSLYAHYLGIANPSPFGIESTITQVTALTVGGFVSLWGACAGSVAVLALPMVIALFAGDATTQAAAGAQNIVFGVLLVAIILAQTMRIEAAPLRFGTRAAERAKPA